MAKKNHFPSLAKTHMLKLSDGRKYTKRETRGRFFYPDEWLEFYDTLSPRQKITFNFLINTGARINEVRHIKLQDIDFDRRSILLTETKTRWKDGQRKIRVIAISDKFARWVKSIAKFYELKPENYFPILNNSSSHEAMKVGLQKAKIEDWYMFSVHNVRKTAETWLLALGRDSIKISKHFGHDLATAAKYYMSGDVFSYEDKKQMEEILGGLMAPDYRR